MFKNNAFFVKNTNLLKKALFSPALSASQLTASITKSGISRLSSSSAHSSLSFFNRNAQQSTAAAAAAGKRLFHSSATSRFAGRYSILRQEAKQEVKQQSQQQRPRKSGYPVNSHSNVGYWLIGTSGLVFGIVVLGGLTRLTESGLSITEWRPITGSIPPLNEEEWIKEFNKYKESPEFKQLNSHITLEDYKFIFFMEWAHRLWGRAIGVTLVLPALYFALRRRTSAHMNRRFIGLALLLGLQGAVGWWMVYSGLDQKQLDDRQSKPTVSQYRLTTHLGAAFLLYLGMLWTGLEIIRENQWIKNPETALKTFAKLESPVVKPFRRMSLLLLGLTFITAMSGGMVAGLDAGLIYNTFPKMGDGWVPSSNELFSPLFARKPDQSDIYWRNLFENPTTVQLVHRILAITTFSSIFAAHMYVNRNKVLLPKKAVKLMHYAMGMVTLQAALGISTLIYLVPIPLAAAHQAGAVGLLTICLAFAARLRKPRFPIRILIMKLRTKLKKAGLQK